jgi:hypothetical protein
MLATRGQQNSHQCLVVTSISSVCTFLFMSLPSRDSKSQKIWNGFPNTSHALWWQVIRFEVFFVPTKHFRTYISLYFFPTLIKYFRTQLHFFLFLYTQNSFRIHKSFNFYLHSEFIPDIQYPFIPSAHPELILGHIYPSIYFLHSGRACPKVRGFQWWRWHCATSRKVAASIPDSIIRMFHSINASGHTVAPGWNR